MKWWGESIVETVEKYKVNFIVLLHLIAFSSLIFPYGFPLFTIILICFFLFTLMKRNIFIRINVKTIVLYLGMLLFVLAIVYDNGILYQASTSDLINVISMFLLVVIIGKYSGVEFKLVVDRTLKIYAYIVSFLAAISLLKFYYYLNNIQLDYFNVPGRGYPSGSSLMMDYNMFALGMLIGVISLTYLLKQSNSFLIQLFVVVSNIMVIVSIVFSGSRRGWILLIPIVLYLFYVLIRKIIKNKKRNNILMFVLMFFSILFLTYTDVLPTINIDNTRELERLQYRLSTLESLTGSYDSRTVRLDYGFELLNERNYIQLFLGNGFDYLIRYGNHFNVPGGEDYPHNQLLSAALYGGLITVVVTIIIIMIPIIVQINYRVRIEYFFIYLLALIFLFQSGNSLYTINILWLVIAHYCALPNEKHSFKKIKDINTERI